jgi:hypothetical protein
MSIRSTVCTVCTVYAALYLQRVGHVAVRRQLVPECEHERNAECVGDDAEYDDER